MATRSPSFALHSMSRTASAGTAQGVRGRARALGHRVVARADAKADARAASATRAVCVITGGARGLGYHLARALVARSCAVVLASRDGARAETASRTLGAACAFARCDVGETEDVEALGRRARETAERLDVDDVYWINAAGAVTKNAPLCDVDAREISAVVRANLLGPLLGARTCERLARETSKRVVVFNFGFSDWGANLSKSAATHKSTKTGLSALTKALNAEVRAMSPPIRCEFHQLSPGLALTRLLLGNGNANPISKRVFNALAEEPSVIADALVDRMLALPEGSTTPVEYLTPLEAARRVFDELPRIVTGSGGRHFDANGDRVRTSSDVRYDDDGVELLPFE